MKIAIICNDSFGIINYRMNLALALKSAGHQVIFITPNDEYFEVLRGYGFELHSYQLSRLSTNPITELRAIASIFALLKQLKPNMLLSFTIKANLYGGLCARLLHIPNIPNITGMGSGLASPGLKTLAIKMLYRFALAKSKLIFCQNPDDKQQLQADNLLNTHTPIQLLPGSGVDLHKFTFTPHNPAKKRYIFVARILEEKGIIQFCEAAKQLHANNREFIVLGRADEREPETLKALHSAHQNGFVNYKGLVNNVHEEVGIAFASVLPSRYREGTPRSLLESLAVGTPIITTNNIGCKEALVEQENGFSCDAQSTASLIEAIHQLEKLSPTKYHTMCQTARTIAEEKFDEHIVLNHYLTAVKPSI